MTIAELITELRKHDENLLVVLRELDGGEYYEVNLSEGLVEPPENFFAPKVKCLFIESE